MAKKFTPKTLSFEWYSSKDLLKTSVCEITRPASFDPFGHPVTDGLYDLRMGSFDRDQICQTCKMGYLHCPGHFGHIKLARVVCNPILFDTLYGLLKSMCFGCKNFKLTNFERICIYTKIKALRKGVILSEVENLVKENSIERLEEILNSMEGEESGKQAIHYQWVSEFFRKYNTKVKCVRCGYKAPTLAKAPNLRVLKTMDGGTAEYFTPEEMREYLFKLYSNESALIEEFFNSNSCEMFFIELLPVLPNKFRPARYVNGMVIEHPTNSLMAKIMGQSLHTENDTKYWPDLQAFVYFYYDSSKQNISSMQGHKQILEKKEGLFRKNIMGKRVNYAARTVISPDPSLETREIGVPLVFAEKLTFPERVTRFNFDKLRQAVLNGTRYPGCNFVQNNNALIDVEHISDEARFALANQLLDGSKVVWRHLEDGDPVMVNRQPTLHAVSLMTHSVRVLKNEKTLRMHYVNCKPYNADFDGDEMNIHFPQSLTALAECKETFMTDHNYFVLTTGKPIRGLEQDHVVAAANLTFKDTFFKEDEFFNLVSSALYNSQSSIYRKRIYLPGPCIYQPVRLYSGKQVISTIFQNFNVKINYKSACKMNFKSSCSGKFENKKSANSSGLFEKYQGDNNEESNLFIQNGFVHTGILDKSTVGATSFSLIHACGEVYGYYMCNELLTAISRVVNRYIGLRGFTVRFDDILMNSMTDKARHEIFMEGHEKAIFYQKSVITGNESLGTLNEDYVIPNDFFLDNAKCALLDGKMRCFMNSYTSKIVQLLNDGLYKPSPKNNMADIILTGAKGSMVNLSQISCALGQQELEGRRVPFMISGKTLPCFRPLEMSPSAGGYVFERFLTGVNPATFFFHCMAGREGLIDTSIKTANSGYLQRCLIKHLETVKVEYDRTVRSDRKLLQFNYGDDGLDCAKESYLKNLQFYEKNIDLFKKIDNLVENNTLISPLFTNSLLNFNKDFVEFMKNRYVNSLIDPGRPVGVIAGHSIGEPSTQMTLNTFHLAGVGGNNVTLGIPRLKEILMVASKNIKTPIIKVPVREKHGELKALFKRVYLENCLESISLQESFVQKAGEYKKNIKIIFDIKEYQDLCAKCLDSTFLRLLGKEIKKRSSAVGITEYTRADKSGTQQESKEDESFNESESSSSVSESDEKQSIKDDVAEEVKDEGFLEDLDDVEQNSEDSTDNGPLINLKRITSRKFAFEIYYPPDFNVFLMPIIKSIIQKLVIKEIPGFEKAELNDNLLNLEGSDFRSLSKEVHGIDLMKALDFYNSYSNDINAILNSLGIEAARAVIVQEIRNVFDVYGININIRHLYLVADYMTRDGKFAAFSRNSFNMDDSYLLKMSFESCYTFLKNSSIFHQKDNLLTPSACLTVGKCINQGTGSFDLLYNLDICDE